MYIVKDASGKSVIKTDDKYLACLVRDASNIVKGKRHVIRAKRESQTKFK